MDMNQKLIWNPPFDRPLNVVTLCPCGVCTCIMLKMNVEKVLGSLGIESDIVPSTEQNPMGNVYFVPDVLIAEGINFEHIKDSVPAAVKVWCKDLSQTEKLKADLLAEFVRVGWMKKGEEND